MKDNRIKHELWSRGVLTWKLHDGQKRVYESLRGLPIEVREALVLISRRWGKSFLGVIMALEDCLQNPGGQVFIVGPNLKQTRKIVAPLINEVGIDAPTGLIKQSKSELLWHVGDSTLIIGAFDTAIESFRGLRATSIYLEESGLANSEEYEYTLKSVLRPTLMHSRGRIVHLTTPAVEMDHPLHTITLPLAEVNKAFFKYTIYDNPLLSKDDIEQEIKDMGGIESSHCQRELLCEIVKEEESLIIPEFNEDTHVKELEIPDFTYYQTSIDFGGSRDNHGVLLAYYDFMRDVYCVLDERFLPINTGTEIIIDKTLEMERENNVAWLGDNLPRRVIDAPGQTFVDITRLKFTCHPPLKGRDSVIESVNAMRVAFKQGKIEIHPRCHNLIQALKYGRWDKNRKDFMRTKALGHCDMIASLIYNYRHINTTSNPFPARLGLHKHHHHVEHVQRDKDNEETLDRLFYGD